MSNATTTTSITITGTPVELGMQIATSLLTRPVEFAAQQLEPDEFESFCCSLLSATAAIIARKIGVDRAAMLTDTLANVAAAEADAREPKGPVQ
ncbi:hypothetical protein [Acidovorax sp. Q11]